MKTKECFKKGLASVACLGFLSLSGIAQDVVSNFSWTNTSGATVSTTNLQGCKSNGVDVQLESSALGHVLLGSSAYFPEDPDDGGDVTITLTFSSTVYNFRLLINDFDEYEPGGADDGTPSEDGDSFSPPFQSISPSGGNFFTAVGPLGAYTGLDPAGLENTQGWVQWDAVNSITFTYRRPDAGQNQGGWGLLLDSMTFDCEPAIPCPCKPKSYLVSAPTNIDFSGETSALLHLNSTGDPIKQLNISLPDYALLTDADCRKCDTENLTAYGDILSLPIIAGTTPTYVGTGAGTSSEISYSFNTPTVLNNNISLDLLFPPALELSCCKNEVEYCFKVTMITESCEVCELLLCSPDAGQGGHGGGQQGEAQSQKRTSVWQTAPVDGVKPMASTMTVYPNPSLDQISVELPRANGTINILNMDGKVVKSMPANASKMQIEISALDAGAHVLEFRSGDEIFTTDFIKF